VRVRPATGGAEHIGGATPGPSVCRSSYGGRRASNLVSRHRRRSWRTVRGSSIGRTSAFGAGCWRFEPSPRSFFGLTWEDAGFGTAPRWGRATHGQQRSAKRPVYEPPMAVMVSSGSPFAALSNSVTLATSPADVPQGAPLARQLFALTSDWQGSFDLVQEACTNLGAVGPCGLLRRSRGLRAPGGV
jgi:hypothetical protein